MGLFSTENAFGRFLDKLGKWIILNFLCLLCCLPIVTAGPAVSAMYAVTLKMAKGEPVSPAADFFKAFKQNFKKSFAIHIIMLLVAAVMALSLYYLGQLQTGFVFYRYFKWILYVVMAVYAMVLTYAYPLQAAFENTVRKTLTNALLLSLMHIFATVIMLAISVGPLILCWFVPAVFEYALFFYLLCGFAVTAFLHSKFFVNIFSQYIQTDDEGECNEN